MLKLRALVIDDSRVMRAVVMKNLQAARLAHFTFVEAEDGADALARFDPAEIDICFVDWNMPTLSGVEFVRKARARGDTDLVPMVMVTSEKTVAKIEEALTEAGADAYICKPFTPDDLKGKLQRVIDRLATQLADAADVTTKSGFLSRLFG
jgi:two-component system chemotaxis response regulator CheY